MNIIYHTINPNNTPHIETSKEKVLLNINNCMPATMNDIPEIIHLFNNMDQIGFTNLIALPNDLLTKMINDNIKNFFIYKHPVTNKIISICKLQVFNNKEDIQRILSVHHLLDHQNNIPPKLSGTYNHIAAYENYHDQTQLQLNLHEQKNITVKENQLIILYSSAYTATEYRGLKINKLLLNYAFKYLAEHQCRQIKNTAQEIIFCLGQRYHIANNNSPLRYFINSFLNHPDMYHQYPTFNLYLNHYQAWQPEFNYNDKGELIKTYPVENEAIGKGLLFQRNT